jgi:hypothetical protein
MNKFTKSLVKIKMTTKYLRKSEKEELNLETNDLTNKEFKYIIG